MALIDCSDAPSNTGVAMGTPSRRFFAKAPVFPLSLNSFRRSVPPLTNLVVHLLEQACRMSADLLLRVDHVANPLRQYLWPPNPGAPRVPGRRSSATARPVD